MRAKPVDARFCTGLCRNACFRDPKVELSIELDRAECKGCLPTHVLLQHHIAKNKGAPLAPALAPLNHLLSPIWTFRM